MDRDINVNSSLALKDFLAATVPMRTEKPTTLEILCRKLSGHPLPTDEKDHHSFLTPMLVQASYDSSDALQQLTNYFAEQTRGNRNKPQTEQLRRHWSYVLLNLSRVSLQHRWLLVSLGRSSYQQDYWLQRYELSYRQITDIVGYLETNDLIVKKKGGKFNSGATYTRIHPTFALKQHLWQFYLDAEQPIEGPYITINKGTDAAKEAIYNLPDDHPERMQMELINDFLRGHRWACKAPVRLIYNTDIVGGGRLVTPYQSLPDRRIRLRIRTLIDEQPICEVDYNANHLRLNLALLHNQHAGDTPYEDICDIAGFEHSRRTQVKAFVTRALGSGNNTLLQGSEDSREKAMRACNSTGMTTKVFETIEHATLKRFPKLGLYKGWGLHAQNLEGQILKDVMLEGIKKDIVCLPVHDAVAVQQQHQDWAREVMLETWQEHLDGVGTKVKVDFP